MATRMAKTMTITLQAIKCTQVAGDSGATLEFFGDLFARGMVLDENGNMQVGHSVRLFHLDDDDDQSLALHTELPVNASSPLLVFKGDFLELGGTLVEEDDFSDDLLGNGFRRIPYNQIKNETISVGFTGRGRDEGQELVARFLVDRVQEKEIP